jgi:CheY-like chemotaxis protein
MATPAGSRSLILVVDDSADLRETLVMILQFEGYRAVAAADGFEALSAAEREQPDLILLDYAMPHLDGPGFCRAYREWGGTAPIVLVTAALRVTTDEACKVAEACGAAAFIEKPFELDALLATIARCLPPGM